MPEQQEGQQQQENGGQGGGQAEFTPITSQDEFDKRLSERLARERSKFADYDDLKAKASKFDEQEQASKTELQKALERADAAEKAAAAHEQAALRATVAAAKGVPAAGLTGSTKEELEKSADELIAWRDNGKKPAAPPAGLRSGTGAGLEQLTGKERAAAALRQLRRGE